jgi:hypothetical protein
LAACPAIAVPQQSPSQSRAQQVAAAFSKQKHVIAEKHGVRKEKYKDVRSEPIVRVNTRRRRSILYGQRFAGEQPWNSALELMV